MEKFAARDFFSTNSQSTPPVSAFGETSFVRDDTAGQVVGIDRFQDVLAFSKDEVFILVRDENGMNVYRVRLDSLGAFALPPAPN